MPATTGFNHVATVTADLDRLVSFYQTVFGAEVTFEMAATDNHPRMTILDLGAGTALNITEQPADTIVGDRKTAGSRGPIDHYGLAVASRVPSRRSATSSTPLALTSATFTVSATAGPCFSEIPTAWSLRFASPSRPNHAARRAKVDQASEIRVNGWEG